MERKKNILEKYSTYFLIIIFAVGTAGHLFSPTIDLMLLITPLTLLLTGGVVLFSIIREGQDNFFFAIILAYIFTLAIEIIGVQTGIIFGDYQYGTTLGIKLFDVPLIIGLNWVFIILGIVLFISGKTKNKITIAVSSALLAVVFDFVLEPIAIKLNYWYWRNEVIPLQNYAAWFIISMLLSFLFTRKEIKIKSRLPQIYVLVQFIFFLILSLFL